MDGAALLPRWFLGLGLIAAGATIAACNAWILLTTRHRRAEHHISLVPYFGGIALVAGFLVLPVPALAKWAWVGLFADAGTVIGVPALLIGLFLRR